MSCEHLCVQCKEQELEDRKKWKVDPATGVMYKKDFSYGSVPHEELDRDTVVRE